MRSRSSSWARCVCAAALATAVAARAEDAGPSGISNVRIENERAAAAVRRALVGAHERLKDRACGAVLQRFQDADGHTLQENLEATGQSPESYLRTYVFFYEGYRLPTCRSRRAKKGLAVTWPGSRAVYVCTTRFTDMEKRSPVMAQAIVIHEMLHTLGLGENPPSNFEITERVRARCR